jgi:glycosyltransferase involved in cell wall biosynthesis
MRIALLGVEDPSAGGSFSAESRVFELFREMQDSNLIFLTEDDIGIRSNFLFKVQRALLPLRENQLCLQIKKYLGITRTTRYEKKLINHGVDFVLYLRPCDDFLRLNQIPFAFTIWDFGQNDLRGFPEIYSDFETEKRNLLYSKATMRANFIVTDCTFTSSRISSHFGFPEEKIIILEFLPNPLLVDYPQSNLRKQVVVYPAQHWAHKNHRVLIDALSLNLQNHLESRRLILTGGDKGNMKKIASYVIQLGLEDEVELKGFIPASELFEIISTSEILVMPSLLGPTNIPPLEALALGVPVVASDRAASNVAGLKGVVLLNPRDIESWAEIFKISYTPKQPNRPEIIEHLQRTKQKNKDEAKRLISQIQELLYFLKY